MLNQIGFVLSYGSGFSEKSNRSDIKNLYAHKEEIGAKAEYILVGTEGLLEIGAIGETEEIAGNILGIYEFEGMLYIATQTKIYKIVNDIPVLVGDVVFNVTKVFITDNGTEIMFVGHNGYAYNPETDTLTDMSTIEGWYPSNTVGFMDGYFIFNRAGTGQFFISKLYSIEIDPLDWATGEAAPDDTRAIVVAGRQLWILGTRSTEVWYNSGDHLFPFTRISGGVTDIGIISHNTVGVIHNSVLFVGNDFRVYSTNGYTPIPISTPGIEMLIEQGNIPDFLSFTFFNDGHYFYVLHLSDDITVVFDIVTGVWHRRASEVEVEVSSKVKKYNCSLSYPCDSNLPCSEEGYIEIKEKRWKINGAINRYSFKEVIGYSGNKFYKISKDIYTEGGRKIKRSATSLPLNRSVGRITISEIQLDMDQGNQSESPEDTQSEGMYLQISKDNGRSWGNIRPSMSSGAGQYSKRTRWLRFGQMRDAIARIFTAKEAPIRILGLWVRS